MGAKQTEAVLELLDEHGPMTGLELVKASDGRLGRGTVYVWLSELIEQGMVTSVGEKPPRLYEIAVSGRRHLARGEPVHV